MTVRGVVIKKADQSEDHQLITFYTRDFGKLTGIAKSVKKSTSQQAGHLDFFNLVDFRLVPARTYSIVASAQSVEVFSGLKDSLRKLAAGFFVLEAFNRLVYDHERDTALWNFLLAALRELDQGEAAAMTSADYLNRLKINLLKVLGYAQEWEGKEPDYFLELLSQKKFLALDLFNSCAYGK